MTEKTLACEKVAPLSKMAGAPVFTSSHVDAASLVLCSLAGSNRLLSKAQMFIYYIFYDTFYLISFSQPMLKMFMVSPRLSYIGKSRNSQKKINQPDINDDSGHFEMFSCSR